MMVTYARGRIDMRLLAISGSLRSESSNTRLLVAARHCLPEDVEYTIADCIGALPHFNPDVSPASSEVLLAWIQQVRESDGLVISTPEYARGYPGSLKNALDWLVQTDAHIDKPFMMLSASARSTVGRDTLMTVLQTMSGIHVSEASTTVSLLGKSLTVEQILADQDIAGQLRTSLHAFVKGIDLVVDKGPEVADP